MNFADSQTADRLGEFLRKFLDTHQLHSEYLPVCEEYDLCPRDCHIAIDNQSIIGAPHTHSFVRFPRCLGSLPPPPGGAVAPCSRSLPWSRGQELDEWDRAGPRRLNGPIDLFVDTSRAGTQTSGSGSVCAQHVRVRVRVRGPVIGHRRDTLTATAPARSLTALRRIARCGVTAEGFLLMDGGARVMCIVLLFSGYTVVC